MGASRSAAALAVQHELVVTRVLDAPRLLVFKAWTEAERSALWWRPRGFTTISCEIDARPGGAWRRRLRSPDGIDCTKRGIYREVVEPERLVFTYITEDADGVAGPETLVTLTFVELDGKTKLTLRHALFEDAADRDAHEGGWTGCIDQFAEYLARDRARWKRRSA